MNRAVWSGAVGRGADCFGGSDVGEWSVVEAASAFRSSFSGPFVEGAPFRGRAVRDANAGFRALADWVPGLAGDLFSRGLLSAGLFSGGASLLPVGEAPGGNRSGFGGATSTTLDGSSPGSSEQRNCRSHRGQATFLAHHLGANRQLLAAERELMRRVIVTSLPTIQTHGPIRR